MATWITFDCFGTLVDWHDGFAAILKPLAGGKTAELLRAYHRYERMLELEKPHRRYKDVLVTAVSLAAEEVGLRFSESQSRTLPESWGRLPLFRDVEPMLSGLRAAGYRLGVLTNCDDDLFASTQRSFKRPFDLVVTAERVRDYKPSLTHFRSFENATGVKPHDWIHVACSWYHDIVPAREAGIRRIWLDRDKTGDDPVAASVRIGSASEVCAAVARIS